MREAWVQSCLQSSPAADIPEAQPTQRQETRNDQEKLQHFVVDRTGKPTQQNVDEHDYCRSENTYVEEPLRTNSNVAKGLVEDMQRLDKLRHGIHRNAGRENRHDGE